MANFSRRPSNPQRNLATLPNNAAARPLLYVPHRAGAELLNRPPNLIIGLAIAVPLRHFKRGLPCGLSMLFSLITMHSPPIAWRHRFAISFVILRSQNQ